LNIDTKELLTALCAIPTVSGYEARGASALDALALPYFDEVKHTPVGNHIYVKRCGRPNAKKFLFDAHFDEIGFLISDIVPSVENGGVDTLGFLRFVTIGGVDRRLLSSAEVTIWGKRAVPGVITSTPPHLQKSGDSEKLPELDKLYIDTGLNVGELKELAPVGTPATFAPGITELKNGRLTGKSLDDKVCIAAIIEAVALLEPGTFDCDVYALFSAMEETGGVGTVTGAFGIQPDCAIALDVDFARGPDTPKHKSIAMGEGPSVSISMATDRALTQRLISFAAEKNMKLQKIVEAKYTGTNGDAIHLSREGVPVAVVSIPLRYMHSCSEVIDTADVSATAELIAGFIREGGAI
jgi:putative aminopeptidase FrvX